MKFRTMMTVPSIIFVLLFTAVFILIVFVTGCTNVSSVPIVVPTATSGTVSNLVIAAGELKTSDNWSINPCKYFYYYLGTEKVITRLSNMSNESASFDMGDGNVTTVLANSYIDYEYNVYLGGNITRIIINKLSGIREGFVVREALTLKLVPKWEAEE